MTRAARLVPAYFARRSYQERTDQTALFEWIRYEGQRKYPVLGYCFHVPNGELRMPHVAARLKAMGVQAGVPDVLLLASRRGHTGCAIELKAPGGAVTPDQRAWHAWLLNEGWCVRVCVGWEAARDVLVWYVEGGT
jgi:VRR-NUC domain-containing protein